VDNRANDHLLLKAIREGDVTAFETLYQRHAPGLLGFILQRIHHQAEAEELLQETFVRLLRDGKFEPNRASLSTYLYIIARNLSLNYIRDRGARHQATVQRTAGMESDVMWLKPQADLDEQVSRKQQLGRLQEALGALPESQREAFILRHHHGRSYQEIAEIAAIPVGTAKSRVHLAVSALRGSLGKTMGKVIPLKRREHG